MDEIVRYGAHAGKKWSDVPQDALEYYITSKAPISFKVLAEEEMARRRKVEFEKSLPVWTGEETVSFGKFRGMKWSQVDMSTINWYLQNLRSGPLTSEAEAEKARRESLQVS